MDISNEDSFRLNVMLADDVKAVRINESTMTVYGLSKRGESTIKLNPNCRDEKYLRRIRELLSSHVMGSPGGYPVYLKRWTRMGQARDESLERLLMLGEPEAVVAVVHAAGLTSELADRAWWSMPDAANARCMLESESIIAAPIGKELAQHLIEYLPFEEDHEAMMESIRLVLQPGLVDIEERERLWVKAKHKNTYFIGFLHSIPDDLPEQLPADAAWEKTSEVLSDLLEQENPFARQICRCLSAQGQTFLDTVSVVLKKPANQEVVVELLKAVRNYFSPVCIRGNMESDMSIIIENAHNACSNSANVDKQLDDVLKALPGQRSQFGAMLALSCIDEVVVTPIFSRSDAIGTVMRRKLEPVVTSIQGLLHELRTRQE